MVVSPSVSVMNWEEGRKMVETKVGVMLQMLRERQGEARKTTKFLLNAKMMTCSVKRGRRHVSRR